MISLRVKSRAVWTSASCSSVKLRSMRELYRRWYAATMGERVRRVAARRAHRRRRARRGLACARMLAARSRRSSASTRTCCATTRRARSSRSSSVLTTTLAAPSQRRPRDRGRHRRRAAVPRARARAGEDLRRIAVRTPAAIGERRSRSDAAARARPRRSRSRPAMPPLTCTRFGWVHGDINPSNLIVDDDDRVVLVDLGVVASRSARAARSAAPTRTWRRSRFAARRGRPATDVFALGVVLWELVAGERLFHRGPPWLSMAAVIEATPRAAARSGARCDRAGGAREGRVAPNNDGRGAGSPAARAQRELIFRGVARNVKTTAAAPISLRAWLVE